MTQHSAGQPFASPSGTMAPMAQRGRIMREAVQEGPAEIGAVSPLPVGEGLGVRGNYLVTAS